MRADPNRRPPRQPQMTGARGYSPRPRSDSRGVSRASATENRKALEQWLRGLPSRRGTS